MPPSPITPVERVPVSLVNATIIFDMTRAALVAESTDVLRVDQTGIQGHLASAGKADVPVTECWLLDTQIVCLMDRSTIKRGVDYRIELRSAFNIIKSNETVGLP